MKDLVSEKCILSGLYKYGRAGLSEIEDIVSETSFSETNTRIAFSVFSEILQKQSNLDMASVLSRAAELKVSDIIKLNEFDIEIDLNNLRGIAKKVRRLEIIRSALSVLKKTYEEVIKFTGAEPLTEIVSKIESPIFSFSNTISNQEQATQNLFGDMTNYIQFLEDNECDNIGLSTGYPSFDQAIGGGMRRKSVTLLASRTGVGKTTIAGMIARFNSKQNIPVLVLDTEMSGDDYRNKSLAALSRVDISLIEQGKFGRYPDLKLKVKKAAEELDQQNIDYINIAGKGDFEEVLSIARRWIGTRVGKTDGRTNDCLIIYDYFKLMDSDVLSNMSEHQALGFQISKLHDFAVEQDVPALTFVQLNRDGINNEDLSGISQSDRLAWLASTVALFKDKTLEELEQNPDMGNMKLIPLKTRYGEGVKAGDYICLNKLGRYAIIQEVGLKSEIGK